MKKIFTLLLITGTILSYGQNSSLGSDDPQFQNNMVVASTPLKQKKANDKDVGCGVINFTGTTVVCDSGSTIITAVGSPCGYEWFEDMLGTNSLSTADTLATPVLYNDTTFYCRTICSDTAVESLMGIPPHGSNFSGNQRGYWFQAPADFVITGLRVPTDANAGAQTVEVIKFTSGPPPNWSATTNAFVSLGYWDNSSLDTIPTCIAVSSGDYIGIYGSRQGVNSYATGNYSTTIAGLPVTLGRTGMQMALSGNQMQNVFAEPSGSISRTEMIYTTDGFDTTMTQVDVTVPKSYEVNLTPNICTGDSILLGGSYQTMAGIYYDTLQTTSGCDSLLINDLSVSTCTGIEDNSLNNKVMVYPNPVEDYLTVKFLKVSQQKIDVRIVDALGRVVEEIIVPENSQKVQLDLSLLKKGLYFVNVQDGNENKTYKITKE